VKVTTESGAVYEFTKDGSKYRRLTKRNPLDPEAEVERRDLRQDGTWLKLSQPVEPVVGMRMFLLVEPALEPVQFEGASITVRETTVVVGIE